MKKASKVYDLKGFNLLRASVITGGIIFSCSFAYAGSTMNVTNGYDSGQGSLREALNSGASTIVIDASVTNIVTYSSLQYNGVSDLKIVGSGQTVDGSGHDENLLEITKGANLTVKNLSLSGSGDYSVFNQGGGKGIYVSVPKDRTGNVSLKLTDVSVSGVGRHGVHVSDCDLAVCGSGGGGAGDGSVASVSVTLKNVNVSNCGYGGFDSDGVRVDDRGEGDIFFRAVNSNFIDIGADGVELDEGDEGDVLVSVSNSTFMSNGGYCAPIDISGFPESETVLEEGPGHEPTADDSCVEWDETEYVLDLDDGFDIDEAASGSLSGSIVNIEISSNLDEGLDFDEEGADGIDIDIVNITANDNGDEGIKLSELDAGDVVANLRAVTTIGNGDDGIQIEEEDDGDMTATVISTTSYDNKSSKAGLNVSQDGDGSGTLKVRGSDISSIDSNVTEI